MSRRVTQAPRASHFSTQRDVCDSHWSRQAHLREVVSCDQHGTLRRPVQRVDVRAIRSLWPNSSHRPAKWTCPTKASQAQRRQTATPLDVGCLLFEARCLHTPAGPFSVAEVCGCGHTTPVCIPVEQLVRPCSNIQPPFRSLMPRSQRPKSR